MGCPWQKAHRVQKQKATWKTNFINYNENCCNAVSATSQICSIVKIEDIHLNVYQNEVKKLYYTVTSRRRNSTHTHTHIQVDNNSVEHPHHGEYEKESQMEECKRDSELGREGEHNERMR